MRNRRATIPRSAQGGFALLMVMFLASLMLITIMVAAPYVRTERQREKEEEMIWRGRQYIRGIKLYYRKTGRFPTSVDDLTKPKLGSLRFMRQAYKDPMNKEDGTWRFIYVGPSGQLIGSLKPPQTFQLPGQPGTPAGTNRQPTTSFGASGFGQAPSTQAGSQQGQPGQQGQAGATQPGAAQNGTNAAQTGSPTPGSNPTTPDDAANATPSGLLNSDSPVLGGNIIGVGSKINKRSVIVYEKAKNYRLFEFVWNPSKDLANAMNQQMGVPNAPIQNQQGVGAGQTGFGQSGFGQGGFGSQNNQQNNPPANSPGMPMPTPPPTQDPPQQ
jgi:hypothetical protein